MKFDQVIFKRIKHWILQVIHIIVSYINWYKFICSGLLAFDFTVATIYWMSLCPFRVLKLFSFDIWTRLARIQDFLREFQEKCLFLRIVQSLVLVTTLWIWIIINLQGRERIQPPTPNSPYKICTWHFKQSILSLLTYSALFFRCGNGKGRCTGGFMGRGAPPPSPPFVMNIHWSYNMSIMNYS